MKHNIYNFCTELRDHNGIARLTCGNLEQVIRVDSISYASGEDPELTCILMADASDPNRVVKSSFAISRVIFNNPATIVFWMDGTKTVVKCSKDDIFSEEVGLAMAFAKKACGNDNSFRDKFGTYIPNYMKNEKKKPKPGQDIASMYPNILLQKKLKEKYTREAVNYIKNDIASVRRTSASAQYVPPKKETKSGLKFVSTANILFQFFSRNPDCIDLIADYERPKLDENIIKLKRKDGSTFFYTYRQEDAK